MTLRDDLEVLADCLTVDLGPLLTAPPTVELTVYGSAEPAGSKRAFKRGNHIALIDANPGAAEWKRRVAQAAGESYDGPLLDGALAVEMIFYRPRPAGHFGSGRNSDRLRDAAPRHPVTRPDALKLARGCEDALTGVLYRDDAQIVEERLSKRFGTPARCVIRVWALDEATAANDTHQRPEEAA